MIQRLFLHLKLKVGTLTLILRSLFHKKAEYVEKLLTLIKQKRNLEQDLIIVKPRAGPIEKILKHRSSVFMNIMDNTVIVRLMIDSLY